MASSLLEERFGVRVSSLSDFTQSNPHSEIVESQCSSRSEFSEHSEKRKTSRNLVKRILRLLQEMLVSLIKVKLNQIVHQNQIIIPHFKNAPLSGVRKASTSNIIPRELSQSEEQQNQERNEAEEQNKQSNDDNQDDLEQEKKEFQILGDSALVTQGCGLISHIERSLCSSALNQVRTLFAQTAVSALLEALKMEKDVKEGLGFLSKLGMRRFKSINENKYQIQEELQVLWVMHNLATVQNSLESSERAPLFSGTRSS